MYHVELRQDGDRVRAFNLTEVQVRERFLQPLAGERPLVVEDKQFDPLKVKLTVLEGPKLRLDQLTLGRGWSEAERSGQDVTAQFSAGGNAQQAPSGTANDLRGRLKERIIGRLSAGPMPLSQLPGLVADLMPGQRASAQLAECELAVWELLHQRRVYLGCGGEPLPETEWEPTILDAGSWFGEREVTVAGVS